MKFQIHKPTDVEILHAVLAGQQRQLIARPAGKSWTALQAAFQIMCEELGIADKPNTVEVSFLHILHPGPDADGATSGASLDPIQMELKIMDGYQVLPILAHEMFHVRDLVTGVMKYEGHNELYHGQPVRKVKNHMLSADEAEAYRCMFPLTLKVLDRLPLNLAVVFTKDYETDVRPPTLREYYVREGERLTAKIKKAEQAAA
jgi:hypothetical protein